MTSRAAAKGSFLHDNKLFKEFSFKMNTQCLSSLKWNRNFTLCNCDQEATFFLFHCGSMQNTESYSCIYSTKMPLFVLASLYTTDIRGPCFKRDFGLTLYIHDWDSERHQPIFVRMLHDLIFEVGQNKIQSYPLQSLLVLISWRRLYLGIPCVIDLRCSDDWCLSFPCMAI